MRTLITFVLVLVLASCEKEEEQWPGPGNLYDPKPPLDSTGAPIYAIFIPNSFSPNGDAVDDHFGPKGYGISNNYSMEIYSRNGNRIFYTTYVGETWNGTANYGTDICQSGYYSYIIRFTCPSGIAREGYGNVLLIK